MRIHAMAVLALVAVACGAPAKPAEEAMDMPKEDPAPKWETDSPKPAATVAAPAGQRHDQYDKEATEVSLKRASRQVKDNCGFAKDDDGKASGPWGKATLSLVLGHNGHMKSVTIPPPYDGKPVGSCVEKAFDNLSFPPWAGQDTPIDWEVEIDKPDAAGAKKK